MWTVTKLGYHIGIYNVVGTVGKVGVEDELRMDNGVADVMRGINGSLHLLAVVVDGVVALSRRIEFVTQEDGVRSLVRLEEVGDRCHN